MTVLQSFLPKPLPDDLLVRMVASFHDPIEVVRFAEDYYRLRTHFAERECALAMKRPLPKFPHSRSKYMQQLLALLNSKLRLLVLILSRDELVRLGMIVPEWFGRIAKGENDLSDIIVELLSLPATEFAPTLRTRLPELERRFAS